MRDASDGPSLLISSGSSDAGATSIVNPFTGVVQWSLKGAELQGAECAAAEPIGDDHLLLLTAARPLLHTVGLQTAERCHLRSVLPGVARAVAAHPSGSYVCAAIEERIYTWMASTGQLLTVVGGHYQPVGRLAFSDDGALLFSAGDDGQLFAWNLASLATPHDAATAAPEPLRKWNAHGVAVSQLFVCRGGADTRVCTLAKDRTVKMHAVASADCLLTVVLDCAPTSCCTDNAETRLFIGTATGFIVLIRLYVEPVVRERHVSTVSRDVDSELGFAGHSSAVGQLRTSPDGARLASGDHTGVVKIWHVATRQCLRTIEFKGPIVSLRYVPLARGVRDAAYKSTVPIAVLQKQLCERFDGTVAVRLAGRSRVAVRNQLMEEFRQLQRQVPTEPVSRKTAAAADVPVGVNGDESAESVKSLKKEIKRLKRANHDLYTFAVDRVLGKNTDS